MMEHIVTLESEWRLRVPEGFTVVVEYINTMKRKETRWSRGPHLGDDETRHDSGVG
jgi:hypothetical protein